MTASSQPPALVFLDFDGTIATKDTGGIIIDAFMGAEARRALDDMVLNGELSYREAIKDMWATVTSSWDDAVALVGEVPLDPKFPELFDLCMHQGIPITILSGNIVGLVEHFMRDYTSKAAKMGRTDQFKIIANDIELDPSGWRIKYCDESEYGHDKGNELRAARARHSGADRPPAILFAGDGVSDFSGATEADVVFAKRGKDLEEWCKRHNVACTAYDDMGVIVDTVHAAMNGSLSPQKKKC